MTTMTNIKVLTDRCISSGNCVDVAPELFDMDDAGIVVALADEVGEDGQANAEQAAEVCPVQAILLGS
jgi:ferredoxin